MDHSPKFTLVKYYFDNGLWSESRVKAAVGKWITAEESEEIFAGDQEETTEPGIVTVQETMEPVEETSNEPTEETDFVVESGDSSEPSEDPYAEEGDDSTTETSEETGEETDEDIEFLDEEASQRGGNYEYGELSEDLEPTFNEEESQQGYIAEGSENQESNEEPEEVEYYAPTTDYDALENQETDSTETTEPEQE